MSQQDLQARIQNLEDIEAIKQLMYNYTYWLDYGEFDTALDCFTDEAKIDIRQRGGAKEGQDSFELTCVGKEEIRKFYGLFIHQRERFTASHLLLNPVVTVDGEKATGIFYLLEPTAIQRAIWGHGRYDLEFVKLDGQWKIGAYNFEWNFNSPQNEGWVETPMVIL